MMLSAGSRPPWFPLPPSWRAHAAHTSGTVLLETASGESGDCHSYLFHSPQRLLEAPSPEDLNQLFADLEAATAAGLYTAGCLHYEAAYPLHGLGRHGPKLTVEEPIARFGLYASPLIFDHRTGQTTGPKIPFDPPSNPLQTSALITDPKLQIDFDSYARQVAEIHSLLEAGDSYQVNFTTRVTADLLATPLALYEALVTAQPVDFAAIVHLGDTLTLSLSPELFFRTDREGRFSTRPMKGTASRGATPAADAAQADWLRQDEKNRAEHVMIVDLLRNDLGRICEIGSVRALDLFRIETHPTLFQMTSTVQGRLLPGTNLSTIFRALFPGGSITGAPKRRTMEIIRDLEHEPRGVYTGAIGFVTPAGETCFSVPIRTLDVRANGISMGVGGGIVADSTAQAEYEECKLKAAFLNVAAQPVQLIETLLWSNGYALLDLHMERMSASAFALGFVYDSVQLRSSLDAAVADARTQTRVRLLLSPDGTHSIETAPLTSSRENLRVRVSSRRRCSRDPWLQHKTTHRVFYDRELARAHADDFDEVLFLNEFDELAEGAISNIFVEIAGRLYTPPLTSGALPGVLRRKLLATGAAAERTLFLDDLRKADATFVGNALRGLRPIGRLELE